MSVAATVAEFTPGTPEPDFGIDGRTKRICCAKLGGLTATETAELYGVAEPTVFGHWSRNREYIEWAEAQFSWGSIPAEYVTFLVDHSKHLLASSLHSVAV